MNSNVVVILEFKGLSGKLSVNVCISTKKQTQKNKYINFSVIQFWLIRIGVYEIKNHWQYFYLGPL